MAVIVERLVVACCFAALLSACATAHQPGDIPAVAGERAIEVEQALADIMKRHRVNTAGIAVIKNGQVNWTGYYGEQSPDVPASEQTLFDVGSITKTVVTETVLRLAAAGMLSIDASMAVHWLDPDLVDDPRHVLLTPRMALSHTSGFMNWRFFADDGQLAFVNEPGSRFGYSGEGFEYLARFVEAKLDQPFEQLVQQRVFQPASIDSATLSVNPDRFPLIAQSLDSDAQFPGYYCRPEGWCRNAGSFSAAGSMVITVPDYSRFLIQAMRGTGLTPELMVERNRIQAEQDGIDCGSLARLKCPRRVGYGLGWNIAELEDDKTIGHRGSDWSVVSLAYYYESSKDGLVVFLNAPNAAGITAMVDVLELLDSDSPELYGYIARRARLEKSTNE